MIVHWPNQGEVTNDELDQLPWIDEDGEPIGKLTVKELVRNLGEVLTWNQQPEAKAGDLYVFTWIRHHWQQDGHVYRTETPGRAVKLLAHPVRHRKGHWQAPFMWIGLEHPAFLGPVTGSTTNRLRSPDPDVELETVEVTVNQEQINTGFADARRREQPKAVRPGRWERNNRRAA